MYCIAIKIEYILCLKGNLLSWVTSLEGMACKMWWLLEGQREGEWGGVRGWSIWIVSVCRGSIMWP